MREEIFWLSEKSVLLHVTLLIRIFSFLINVKVFNEVRKDKSMLTSCKICIYKFIYMFLIK